MSSNQSAINFNNWSTDEPITLQMCIDTWLLKKADVLDFTSSDFSADDNKRVVICKKCTKSFRMKKGGGRPRMFFKHLQTSHLKPNMAPATAANFERPITEAVQHNGDSLNRKRPHSSSESHPT
jgi:hypothetical protein